MEVESYENGRPSWVDLGVPDPSKAAEASRRLAHKAILLTQQITQQEGAADQEQLGSHLSDARVSRRAEEFGQSWTLRQFPADSVFATT